MASGTLSALSRLEFLTHMSFLGLPIFPWKGSPMMTIDSAIEWFLSHCINHRKLSPHTLKAYRRDLSQFNVFAKAASGEVLAVSVDRNLVQRWLAGMNLVKPTTVRR